MSVLLAVNSRFDNVISTSPKTLLFRSVTKWIVRVCRHPSATCFWPIRIVRILPFIHIRQVPTEKSTKVNSIFTIHMDACARAGNISLRLHGQGCRRADLGNGTEVVVLDKRHANRNTLDSNVLIFGCGCPRCRFIQSRSLKIIRAPRESAIVLTNSTTLAAIHIWWNEVWSSFIIISSLNDLCCRRQVIRSRKIAWTVASHAAISIRRLHATWPIKHNFIVVVTNASFGSATCLRSSRRACRAGVHQSAIYECLNLTCFTSFVERSFNDRNVPQPSCLVSRKI
mmetsp:Transcript_20734/g.69262  ORF Transcript_20734/g.69262 Transcript_20734/m.69262 type:complete len:284 (+) Transcript_20734:3374-4225(+)